MKIVKIDRESIKKNPNTGNTRDYLQGMTHATFEIVSEDMPLWLLEEPFYPTEWENGRMKGEISGMITDEMIEKFKTAKGISVSISQEPIIIDHFPEPEYLFEYVETKLKCNHCKNHISVDEIEHDFIEEDEILIEICPICQQENTFPKYKYERIEDVVE